MATQPTININQQEQAAIVGQIDLQGGRAARVLSGIVSPNNGAAIQAGSSVKLDTANTTKTPWFLVCAASDVGIGRLVYTERNAKPAVGDACEVTLDGIVWCVSEGAINPQVLVQDGTDGAMFVIVVSSGKQRGMTLDGATAAGQLLRVITLMAVS